MSLVFTDIRFSLKLRVNYGDAFIPARRYGKRKYAENYNK